jgi:integrase
MTYHCQNRVLTRPDDLVLRSVIDAYLRHSEANGVHCQEALTERKRVLYAFAEHCGWIPVAHLKAFHLSDWIDGNKRWRSVSTRRAKANMVRACFNWACEQERIDRNPFQRVRYREAERRAEMPDDVLDRLATLASKPFEHAIRFLRLTGCRVGELCRARWRDVDLVRGVWTIHRHKSRRYTGKPKTVALVTQAVALLVAVQAMPVLFPPGPGDLIFTNTRGKAWTRYTLGHTLKRLKRKWRLNCPATLHGIRHQAATAAILNGAPLKLVAEQLGHASTAVTERFYVNVNGQIDAMRAAFEKGMGSG